MFQSLRVTLLAGPGEWVGRRGQPVPSPLGAGSDETKWGRGRPRATCDPCTLPAQQTEGEDCASNGDHYSLSTYYVQALGLVTLLYFILPPTLILGPFYRWEN